MIIYLFSLKKSQDLSYKLTNIMQTFAQESEEITCCCRRPLRVRSVARKEGSKRVKQGSM